MNEIENENPNARRGERETVWAGSQTAAARGAMGLVERGRSGEEATNCRRDPGWGEMYVGDRCFATKVWLFQARELANFLWILDGRSRSGDEENCKNSGFGRLDPSSPAPQGAWLLFPLRTPPDHGSSSRFRGLSTACRLPHLFASIGPLVPAEYSFCVHCSEDEIDGTTVGIRCRTRAVTATSGTSDFESAPSISLIRAYAEQGQVRIVNELP